MTIADRIRSKRSEIDLTQEELAKKAGYSDKTAISKFENAGDNITMKQVKRIAEALGCSPSYLMGWETDEQPHETSIDTKNDQAHRLLAAYNQADDRTKALVDMALGIIQLDAVFPRSPHDNDQ